MVAQKDLSKEVQSNNTFSKNPDDTLSNMSHELRTPLHAILGFSSLALDSNDEEEIRSYLKTINEAAKALGNSLDLMKEHLYSDIESKRLFTKIAEKAAKKVGPVSSIYKETVEDNTVTFPDIKVLAVDDTGLNLTLIEKFLSKEDMLVTCVASGLKAIELCNYKKFDVILLDHMMPVLDGLETLKILRSEGVTTPVIMLTANDDPKLQDEFLLYGDAFLSKPIDFKKLVVIIHKLISDRYSI